MDGSLERRVARPRAHAAPPRVLMCSPAHFAVRYAINPWMARDGAPVDRARARAQWHGLRQAVAERAQVRLVEPDPALPDMCFAANGGLVHGRRFVASRFRHPERAAEAAHYAAWFRAAGYSVIEPPAGCCFEGAGDALFDAQDRLWVGHGPRSDAGCAAWLGAALEVEAIALRLVDPRFYHLDTAFAPLASGVLVWFPAAFDDASRAAVEARFPAERRIAVEEAEACAFACNLVDLGDRVVLNAAGRRLAAALARLGIEARGVALDEFIKAGGAAKCLVLPLDRIAADGRARRVASARRRAALPRALAVAAR